MNLKMWGVLLTLGGFLGAQALPDDPVMKARSQRAQAQGIDEADLPPVPRSVMEPPPLPPPELHVKDSPHAKTAARQTRRRGAKGKAAGRSRSAAAEGNQAKHSQAGRPLGKTARKPGKRVKS